MRVYRRYLINRLDPAVVAVHDSPGKTWKTKVERPNKAPCDRAKLAVSRGMQCIAMSALMLPNVK